MKQILFLILDHGDLVDSIFKELSKKGFNGTVLQARSIKHLLEDEETSDDISFFNISHLENRLSFPASTFCYFIVEQDKVEALKNARNLTDKSLQIDVIGSHEKRSKVHSSLIQLMILKVRFNEYIPLCCYSGDYRASFFTFDEAY